MFITTICGTVIGVIIFAFCYLGFRTGLRLGMNSAKGQVPAKVDPIGAVTKSISGAKRAGKEAEMVKGFDAMMAYSGEPKK